MRRAKEQEMKKQQLSLIQKQAKQEEQYYRQMLIMGLEREKLRQQALAVKAVESRKKQEERQRIIAERLIRQEERVAARNAHQLRIKQLRQPIDDLDLDDGKALPPIHRLPGLELDGKAFADLLMVMEFLKNFGAVLKIDMNDVPTMSEVHAGLMNSADHMKYVRKLAKILLTLVLEYPGLPPGAQSKTFLNQTVRELKITRDNMSELLRMFLASREDSQGRKLGKALESCSFDALSAGDKSEMMAFMCNELLYCRNVVREIEGNIEETARMKGEKWLRDVKIRTLRSLQAKKRMDLQKSAEANSAENANSTLEESQDSQSVASKDEGVSNQASSIRFGTPNSTCPESDPEMKSLAEVKSEAKMEQLIVRQNSTASISDKQGDAAFQRSEAGTPVKKVACVGMSTQPEALTEEEKNMSVEKLEDEIEKIGKDAEDLMEKIADKTCRVRALPYGQDRYHRFYWVLPNLGGVLLESLESGRLNNPGCSTKDHRVIPARDRDVKSCMKDLVDKVCQLEASGSNFSSVLDLSLSSKQFKTEHSERKGKGRVLPEDMQEGWWILQSKEEFDDVMSNLQFRGIRERVLHRNLTRYSGYVKRQSFVKTSPMSLEKVGGKCMSSEDVEKCCLLRVLNSVRLLEEKVFHANIHIRQWKPPEYNCYASSTCGPSMSGDVRGLRDTPYNAEDNDDECTKGSFIKHVIVQNRRAPSAMCLVQHRAAL